MIRAASVWSSLLLGFLLLRVIYTRFGVGIPCPVRVVTGLYCPGCGMFRAVGALLRGNVWQAIRYNALSVVLLPLLLVFSARRTIRYIRTAAPALTSRAEMIVSIGVASVSLLYAIARNLPALAMLRPTGL